MLHPIGMRSADPRVDAAGTFIGSSFVYATVQDWARFGLLYLRDGRWEDERLLPEGWVDHGRRVRSIDESDGALYGAHWWIDQLDTDRGTFRASGYEGQSIMICPPLDLLAVRLGKSAGDDHTATLAAFRAGLVDVFR